MFGIAMLTIMQLAFGMSLLLYMFPFAAALVAAPLLPALFWDDIFPATASRVGRAATAVAELVLGPAAPPRMATEAPPGTLRRAFLGSKAVASDVVRIFATVRLTSVHSGTRVL